jgi:hypothetical protein
MSSNKKVIHFQLKENPEITVEEVYNMMTLKKKYPNREIFYDGEDQIIYSIPKKSHSKIRMQTKNSEN